ncbi:MAG: Nif3-like dinuclear metal center hexameric protein [Kordia sp.]|nr:MAG: Nif3-like dinuclear metal center hexameric protein [Kordia sp.]
MQIKDVIQHMEELAPLAYAESYDNIGLLVGNKNTPLTGILITHDTLEEVVDEAIAKKCNLIVSFHPIVFSGIKKFNGQDYVNRVIVKAIKNDIAIYATHTALDNVQNGVNSTICDRLNLINRKTLIPKADFIYKLTTYVPDINAEELRGALFIAGAGNIGNYNECSFTISGKGTYKGDENSNPKIGEKGVFHIENETQISVTFEKHLESKILKALFTNHPYEEVAYEVTKLTNTHQNIGLGMTGELSIPMNENDFLTFLKKEMNTSCVRHSNLLGKKIEKVAVLGGSGSSAIKNAKTSGADVYITADLKYHDFYQAENSILLCDIGHYESEQYTKTLLYEFLSKKIPNFAIVLSGINTNPVNYF